MDRSLPAYPRLLASKMKQTFLSSNLASLLASELRAAGPYFRYQPDLEERERTPHLSWFTSLTPSPHSFKVVRQQPYFSNQETESHRDSWSKAHQAGRQKSWALDPGFCDSKATVWTRLYRYSTHGSALVYSTGTGYHQGCWGDGEIT